MTGMLVFHFVAYCHGCFPLALYPMMGNDSRILPPWPTFFHVSPQRSKPYSIHSPVLIHIIALSFTVTSEKSFMCVLRLLGLMIAATIVIPLGLLQQCVLVPGKLMKYWSHRSTWMRGL